MAGNTMDDIATSTGQRINLNNGSTSSIHNVEVFINQSDRSKLGLESSSKIRCNTLIGQNWQPSGYYGNMIACNNNYLAYVLESRSGYVVRLIQLKTKDRSLLKKFTGKICDLSFVHANSNVLGIVDQAGNLHIYDLDSAHGDVSKMSECSKLKIFSSSSQPDNEQHRLTWCPFVHDEETNDTHIVAVSHGSRAEVYDVEEIINEYPLRVIVDRSKVKVGRAFIENAHEGDICDLSLSPDGNVLATAGEDGHVKFWQVDIEEGKDPIRLHDYIPHEPGRAVTRLLFCDNHASKDPGRQFWRFLVTASEDSTVLKVWCTVKWKCLQTVTFLPPVKETYSPSRMILNFDLSASYLLITDTTSSVLYILPLYQEPNIGDASFTSITEYTLTQQILSFVISDTKPVPLGPDDSTDEEDDDMSKSPEPLSPRRCAALIRMHCIQTKSLQELQVRFEPPGIMGVPPLLSAAAIEDTDEGTVGTNGGDGILSSVPPLPDETVPSSLLLDLNQPPPLVGAEGGQEDEKPPDIPQLNITESHYAPGQSSPSVKLLSPGLILSNPGSINSPTNTPSSISLTPSHILRSPSDFESFPTTSTGSLPQPHTLSINDKSQIVTIPLKRIGSTDDENNEEMVLTSPSSSLPSAINNNNNDDYPFPSAHDSSVNLQAEEETTMAASNKTEPEEDDDWPVLSSKTEEKSEQDTGPEDNVSALLLTPPSTVDDNNNSSSEDVKTGDEKESAMETATNIVATAITTAIEIVEMSANGPVTEDKEDRRTEGDEEEEEEVKSKMSPPASSPPSANALVKEGTSNGVDDDLVNTSAVVSSEETFSTELELTAPASSNLQQQLQATGTRPDTLESGSAGGAAVLRVQDSQELRSLMELVQQQQLEIHALRNNTQQLINGLQSSLQKSLEDFSESQRSSVSQQFQDQYQRIEKLVKDKPSVETKKLAQSLNTAVKNTLTSEVDKCIKNEFKKTVSPTIQRQMNGVQDQSLQMIRQRLGMIDGTVRETLERSINPQGIVEAVSSKIASILHSMVQKNTEALFINAVLPSFQQSLKEIFLQINEAFKAGMADYLSQVQLHQSSIQESNLQSLHTSLAPNSPLVQMISKALTQELTAHLHKMEQSLANSTSQVVRSAIEENIAATAGNVTQSIKQQKEHIQSLLEEKQYDMAFNFALSTSNLELVTQTCLMVPADEVFDASGECSLTQPVLLSLIQQLAVGLQDEIDLKIKYLEMAILSLDPDDPITSPHLPSVMQLLYEQIAKVEEHLQNSRSGTPGLFRAAKRVRMLADHVKKSTTQRSK